MSNHNGTGAYWNGTYPADSEPVYKGALELRDLRLGSEYRAAMEHVTYADSEAGGEHVQGSAKAYSQDAQPTTRPDGVNDPWSNGATTLTAADDGRLWVDENASDISAQGWFYVLTAGGTPTWTPIGQMLGGALLLDNTNPEFIIHATVAENADNGRESMIIFKGEKSDGTAHELATIRVQQDVGGDDYLGEMIFLANDGSDSNGALTEVMRVNVTDGLVLNSQQISGLADGTASGEAIHYGQVDDSSIEMNGSDQISVKDGGVTSAMLASGTNAHYLIEGVGAQALPAEVFEEGDPGTTFVDLDLSAWVGSKRCLCFFRVDATNETHYLIRKNGDARDIGSYSQHSYGTSGCYISAGKAAYLVCETDASGIIEHKCDQTTDTIALDLLGFIS